MLQPESDSALLTRAYGLAVTPEYASPELLRGESIDSRSDIYSLGVVLHELLTGARPVQPTRPANGDTTPLHGALRDVVSKALQPDPGDRYPDAASFAAALRPFADGKAHDLSWRLKTRSPWIAGLAALAAMAAMAALLTWTLHKRGQERWAREDALPRLQALIAADDYAAAFDLAREIERVTPRDPSAARTRAVVLRKGHADHRAGRGEGVLPALCRRASRTGASSARRRSGTSPCRSVSDSGASRRKATTPHCWRCEIPGCSSATLPTPTSGNSSRASTSRSRSPTRRLRRTAWCSCRRFQQ